jgi:hypothetical protein
MCHLLNLRESVLGLVLHGRLLSLYSPAAALQPADLAANAAAAAAAAAAGFAARAAADQQQVAVPLVLPLLAPAVLQQLLQPLPLRTQLLGQTHRLLVATEDQRALQLLAHCLY